MTKVFMSRRTGDLFLAHECFVPTGKYPTTAVFNGYIIENPSMVFYGIFFNTNCFNIFEDLGEL